MNASDISISRLRALSSRALLIVPLLLIAACSFDVGVGNDTPSCSIASDCPEGQACLEGACTDASCSPQPEVCDMVDNDCDGMIDEECGQPCMSDATCPMGQECVNSVCGGGGGCQPQPEVCDMVDNDCDSMIDEECGQPCMSDATCPMGQVCTSGLCMP